MNDLTRESIMIPVPLHARAAQWTQVGQPDQAQQIVDEMNMLGLEFGFRMRLARYEASIRSLTSLTLEMARADGQSFTAELTPNDWVAVVIRHGQAVMMLAFSAEDGMDLFGEHHSTLVVAERAPGTAITGGRDAVL